MSTLVESRLGLTSAEVRELIIDWVEKHKTIPTETDNNWRIVGGK